MSDAALSEPRAAALESPARADAMKPAAGKTRGRRGPDVRSSDPATGMETPDARKTLRGRRADMGSSDRASGMKVAGACKARRNGRADMGNCRAVKLMKIAAADGAKGRPARAAVEMV
jgi:hypothetical protein